MGGQLLGVCSSVGFCPWQACRALLVPRLRPQTGALNYAAEFPEPQTPASRPCNVSLLALYELSPEGGAGYGSGDSSEKGGSHPVSHLEESQALAPSQGLLALLTIKPPYPPPGRYPGSLPLPSPAPHCLFLLSVHDQL